MFPFDPPENIRNLSDVFRGIKKEHWDKKGQNISICDWNFTDLNVLAVFHFRLPNNFERCTSKLSSFDQSRLV